MGFQDFEVYYSIAREEFSRSDALRHAIYQFLRALYNALGGNGFRPERVDSIYNMYVAQRSQNHSRETAWLCCEAVIVNDFQQEHIKVSRRRGLTEREAHDLCKYFMSRMRNTDCRVFDAYQEIITPMADNGREYRDTRAEPRGYKTEYREPRNLGHQNYNTEYREPRNTRTPPPRQQARGRSGAQERPTTYRPWPYTDDDSSSSNSPPPPSPPRSKARYRYRSPSPIRPRHRRRASFPPPSPSHREQFIDLYAVLGVPHNASNDDIKKAHRKLMLKWHPDRNRGNEEEATRQTARINQAKDVLADPAKRRVYDAGGGMA